MLAMRENVTVQVHDGDAPFAVLVRPDVVAFAIADDAGTIELLYESRGDGAREWARDVLAVYRDEATAL